MTTFKKYLLTLSLAALGFFSLLIISVLVFMNSLYYEINTTGLKNTAETLLAVIGEDHFIKVFSPNDSESAPVSIPLNAADSYRLTLIAPNGYVLWDSHVTDRRLVNHINREEIIAALEGRKESSRRDSISTGEKLLYYALPVFDLNDNVIGVFRLSLSIPGFGRRISSVLFPFLIFSLIMAVAIFWAAFMFSHSLSTSLNRLVKITQTGASLLAGPESEEKVSPEFRSLEKALRALAFEINSRLERSKAEGRRLEAILNGMSEAVFAMDSALTLHLVNPRARELFNLGNQDINSMTLLEATRSTELTEAAKKALATDTTFETELIFRTGAEQYFQIFAAPLGGGSDPNGVNQNFGSDGVVLVLQEITRLVKLERIRKDFVANVSHELRTPIQLIKGFSETLMDTIPEPDKSGKKNITQFIKIIHKNAGIMENLTNDLLVLADLENNSLSTRNMEEFNVAFLINEAVSSVKLQAKKKNIKIIVDCSEELNANLYGSFVIQALINLIDNGIKYSPSKSKLWVNASRENTELLLEVRDKGIGIPVEHLERIFERFYRVDSARSREDGSTGLGLSIVRHIALLHKGKAEAESHAGEGSVFRLRIPQPSY